MPRTRGAAGSTIHVRPCGTDGGPGNHAAIAVAPAPEPPAARRGSYASDAALVAGVRAGDPAAWDAFFVRYEPVLVRDARRIGVPDTVRDDLVCETIGAALEQIADPDGVVPGAISGYLRCALRNRAHNYARGERRRERRAREASEPVAECAGVVASTVSAYTLALVRGPAVAERPAQGAGYRASADGGAPPNDPWPVCDPVRELAHVLAAALRPGERELLERKHAGATHTELAAWLGIQPAAAAKRVTRLRQRLHAVAEAYAAELLPAGRREVCRFLSRAGVGVARPSPAVPVQAAVTPQVPAPAGGTLHAVPAGPRPPAPAPAP